VNGIDCATRLNTTSAKALKSAGIDYVGRYLGPANNWKTMQSAEAKAILDVGLNLISIWETNPTHKSYFTHAQGVSDAKSATAYATSVGQPKGTAIYFTVDYNAQSADYAAILDYFAGVRSAIGEYKLGAYGSYGVINYLHQHNAADYYMQTYAWSSGKVASFIHVYQYKNDTKVAGISVDLDQILKDPGGWKPMSTIFKLGSSGDAVKSLQEKLKVVLKLSDSFKVDGVFGAATRAAVKSFQVQHHLTVDGIAGPQTLSALDKAYKALEQKSSSKEASDASSTSKAEQVVKLLQQAESLLKEIK
jgi:hypothetical protein